MPPPANNNAASGGQIQLIKYAPPPPELPIYGKHDPKDVSYIGRTNYVAALEEKKFIFGIKRTDRRRHVYVIGKGGVGKSKMLELMIRQDIAHGYGLCFMDPHGETITELLDAIPENRVDDVCVTDPSDIECPVSFNPLSNVEPTFKPQLAQAFIEVMQKQLGANWTPRLEHIFRFTILALLDYPFANLRDIITMLTDMNFRHKVTDYIKDDMVKHFWTSEFAINASDSDATIPLINKLSQYFSDPMLRNIFTQKENKINLETLIHEQKIIFINLAKDKIGEEGVCFLGSMFITKLRQAGIARAKLSADRRPDFYIYIDEFQTLITDTFENILGESRKYGFNLTVSHQYGGQISTKTMAAVLGNVSSLIVFRVVGDDAVKLKSEFAPIFEMKDMINLGVGQFYIKMIIDGEMHDPFSAETLRVMPMPFASNKEKIIASSRRRYSLEKTA